MKIGKTKKVHKNVPRTYPIQPIKTPEKIPAPDIFKPKPAEIPNGK